MILQIAERFDLRQGHVKILIDNTTALEYGTKPRDGDGPFKHLTDDYDLKCWVSRLEMRLLKTHNIVLSYKHVYSHQDDPLKLMKIHRNMTLAEATIKAKSPNSEALINIACDKAAERGREILAGMPKTNPLTPKEVQVVLDIGGTHIYRNMKEKIEWAAHHEAMEEHLESKYKWGESIKAIDWKSHGKAYKTLPPADSLAYQSKIPIPGIPRNYHLRIPITGIPRIQDS